MASTCSQSIANALGTPAVQEASVVAGTVEFQGTVDFSPDRVVILGPDVFPLQTARPGPEGRTVLLLPCVIPGELEADRTNPSNSASSLHS